MSTRKLRSGLDVLDISDIVRDMELGTNLELVEVEPLIPRHMDDKGYIITENGYSYIVPPIPVAVNNTKQVYLTGFKVDDKEYFVQGIETINPNHFNEESIVYLSIGYRDTNFEVINQRVFRTKENTNYYQAFYQLIKDLKLSKVILEYKDKTYYEDYIPFFRKTA